VCCGLGGGRLNWQNGVDAPISMNLTLLLLLFTVKINLYASKEVKLFCVCKCTGGITVALVFIAAALCGCCNNNVACTALLCPESNIVIIKPETLHFYFVF
jgi:hypothetical protein